MTICRTVLLPQLRRHLARKQSCLVLKYKKDTRYSLEAVISTHDRSELAAKPVELLEEVRYAAASRTMRVVLSRSQ